MHFFCYLINYFLFKIRWNFTSQAGCIGISHWWDSIILVSCHAYYVKNRFNMQMVKHFIFKMSIICLLISAFQLSMKLGKIFFKWKLRSMMENENCFSGKHWFCIRYLVWYTVIMWHATHVNTLLMWQTK